MTNGSCHSTQESNVHTWETPASSARCAQSTTCRAGGSVCITTATSISVPPSGEVLAQATGDVAAVPRLAGVATLVDDRPAPGEHGVHPAGDPHPLVAGVVDRHVVRARRDGLFRHRVVD